MIKSNRIIDFSKFKGMKPQAAVGKYCLDLTDPVTGKVLERMSGNNHVFEDVLYADASGSTWINVTSGAWLVLNDSPLAVDPDMPYVMGQSIGYGRPSQAGLGLFRGAYNAANQKLAEWDLTSIRWKFQYDFTGVQAIGTIRQIGLTHQYNRAFVKYQQSRIPILSNFSAAQYTSDERYSYGCSSPGIVSKYDNYLGTQQQIDVSSIVGTSGTFAVAYAPATGKYYIVKYGVEMYEFTDSTFSTLSNTYPITNILTSTSAEYVYGNYLYMVTSSHIYKADFVNNIAYVNVLNIADIQNNAAVLENDRATNFSTYGTMGSDSKIMCFSAYRSSSNEFYKGFIFDMATDDVIGYMSNSDTYSHCVHPLATNRIFCSTNGAMSAAITAKKLDADFVKPADRGMTATYELEVFW
jgi:hypothetical protein